MRPTRPGATGRGGPRPEEPGHGAPAPIEDAAGLDPHRIRDLTVPVGPIRDRGGRSRSAVLVAVAVVAIIGGAFGAARLFPAGPSPTPFAFPSGRPSAASPAATRYPWPAPSLTAIAPATLVAGAHDGTLEGNLVVMDARITAAPAACGSGRTGDRCVTLTIGGLDLPVERAPALDFWQPPLPSQQLVLEVSGGGLVYLGATSVDPRAPVSMTALIASRPISPFPMTLVPVSGWLIVDPAGSCPGPSSPPSGSVAPIPSGCAPPSPFLADDEPAPDGTRGSDRGSDVVLEQGAIGLTPDGVVTGGTWLVRHGFNDACPTAPTGTDASAAPSVGSCFDIVSLGWDIVARLDAVRILQVSVP